MVWMLAWWERYCSIHSIHNSSLSSSPSSPSSNLSSPSSNLSSSPSSIQSDLIYFATSKRTGSLNSSAGSVVVGVRGLVDREHVLRAVSREQPQFCLDIDCCEQFAGASGVLVYRVAVRLHVT